VQTHLLDFAREDTEVLAAPIDEFLGGRRYDLVPVLPGEANDPAVCAAYVDPWKAEGCPRTHAGSNEAAPLIGRSRDEDYTPARTERGQACEDRLLRRLAQSVGMADHQALRSAEKRRRRQVVERRGQAIQVLVRPQGPAPHLPSAGREPRTQELEAPLDEVGLLAVEQVAGPERPPRQRGEGIGGLSG